jgi:hypothetical protein
MKWMGQPLAKRRGNGEDLISLGIAAATMHAECFIQTYTKHGISGFKRANAIHVCLRLVPLEWKAPILRH